MYGHPALYHKDVPRGAAYSISFPAPHFFSAPGRILTFPISCAPLSSLAGADSSFFPLLRPAFFSCRGRFHTFPSLPPRFLLSLGRIPPFPLSYAPLSSRSGAILTFSLSCAPLSSRAGADSTLFHLFRPAFSSRRGGLRLFSRYTPRASLRERNLHIPRPHDRIVLDTHIGKL